MQKAARSTHASAVVFKGDGQEVLSELELLQPAAYLTIDLRRKASRSFQHRVGAQGPTNIEVAVSTDPRVL